MSPCLLTFRGVFTRVKPSTTLPPLNSSHNLLLILRISSLAFRTLDYNTWRPCLAAPVLYLLQTLRRILLLYLTTLIFC